MSKRPLRIVRLEASNVKRLTAVELEPGASPMIVVGGRNGQGKSSLLDSIMFALAGKKAQPSRPVREGTERALVSLDLGEVTVRRTITPSGGGTLTLKGKDGTKYGSPQALLDKVVGDLTFDPLSFVRLPPARQADVLRKLSGIDLDAFDRQEGELRLRRKETKRRTAELRARFEEEELKALEEEDLPEEDVDTAALLQELERRRETNLQNQRHREVVSELGRKAEALEEEVQDLRRRLEAREDELEHVKAERTSLAAVELVELEEDSLREELATAGDVNRRIARRRGLLEVRAELAASDAAVEALTETLVALAGDRATALEEAELPVDGLGLEAGQVTYGGLPLDQASSAEQLRVSVAMGLAANPRLRVLLIRDGSLLDDESLAMVAAMAAERDAQVWVERVGTGEEVSVVIEAGAIQEDRLDHEEVTP